MDTTQGPGPEKGQAENAFDILWHLNKVLQDVGLHHAQAGGLVTFAGQDPIFEARLRMGACIGIPIMANAVAIAAIWKMRSGRGQDLHLDLRQAIHGITPHYQFHPSINGYLYPHATADDNPFLLEPYRTRDGRSVMASGVYPHMVAEWLRFLDCTNSTHAVAQTVAGWDAQALEDAAAKAGLPLAICRTPEEWLAHPHGALLASTPIIGIRKIAESAPEPFGLAQRPLAGVRVLSFTHAIAGPVVGRTLAEQGADVLNVTFPNHFEHDFIYDEANVGSRSCWLDLRIPEARNRMWALAKGADVVVDNHRGFKLARYGLTPERLAESRPGTILVSIRAYGLDGPWAERGGFDMNASAASGIMVIEGGEETPRLPPTGMINDFITGYMGALGATAALLKRAQEGGSYHVTINLTRTAMWYLSLGLVDPCVGDGESHRLLDPETITDETPFGTLYRLAPPVVFSETPGWWRTPILSVRGSSRAQWL